MYTKGKWKKMVHQKFDYFSAMIDDISIAECMEILKIDRAKFIQNVTDVIVKQKRRKHFEYFYLGSPYYSIDLNGAHFCVPKDYFETSCEGHFDASLCEFRFPKVYLNFTGGGLDYLRNLGSNIDAVISDQGAFGYMTSSKGEKIPKYKLTRVDVAYDFVNCYDEFMTDAITFLHDCAMKDVKHLITLQNGVAPTYSMKNGPKEKTIYIGATTSEKILRIYDKGLQLLKRGAFKSKPDWMDTELKKNSDFEFRSWFRFECQCRNNEGYKILFGYGGDMDRIFKHFCEYYSICYPRAFGSDLFKKRVPCFEKLLNYKEVKESIGLNDYYFWTSSKTPTEKIKSFIDKYRTSLVIGLADPQINLVDYLNQSLWKCYHSKDPLDQRSYENFISQLAAYTFDKGYDDIYEMSFETVDGGCLQIIKPELVPRAELDRERLMSSAERDAIRKELRKVQLMYDFISDVFDTYRLKIGGIHNDKIMMESIDEVIKRRGYNGFTPIVPESDEGGNK